MKVLLINGSPRENGNTFTVNKRNGYLISKALHTFMWASILSSVAQLLSTLIDAIVVSNLIGPDAISAVNVSVPVLSMVGCFGILLGIGGSIVAAKAMGLRNMEEANRVFSISLKATLIFGLFVSIAGYLLAPTIVGLVCPPESRIYPLAASYLQIILIGMVFMLGAFTLQSFVKTDGNPKLVMRAVVIGCMVNLVFDMIFIKVFDMGIAGSAWASVLSYMAAFAVCLLHFKRPHCSLRFHLNAPITNGLGNIAKEGAPLSMNSLLLGVCTYLMNTIVLRMAGDNGMYVWSLCLQLFTIMQLVLGGISTSIYAIGGLLAGERDMEGLGMLTRRVLLYVCSVLAFIMVVMLLWPEMLASLFGGSRLADNTTDVAWPIRIYALLLVPYAVVAVLRSLYQIIGFRGMSMILSITQLVAMVVCVWLLALVSPDMLWWGFPLSGIILLLVTMAFSWQKKTYPRPLPKGGEMGGGKSLNSSVRLTREDVRSALAEIKSFLKESQVSESTVFQIRLCCEELLYNIVDYAVEKYKEKHFADIHIHLTETQVNVLLKDDGRPFNPVFKKKPTPSPSPGEGSLIDTEHLGLLLVAGESSSINYKYMYDQNMVFLTFTITNKQ
ncbi:MAG: MATE family efflux transporter [Prevotella sp.]|nr:MATE family efflux transporter [Prevotella sp.]